MAFRTLVGVGKRYFTEFLEIGIPNYNTEDQRNNIVIKAIVKALVYVLNERPESEIEECQ